ncbi:MAG: amino acid ABC transporter substrate-binding protein [Bacteroidetes bacterium]|nr:amino acid ABC transporter substrate-binding protein [Bacteroidota bacterium]
MKVFILLLLSLTYVLCQAQPGNTLRYSKTGRDTSVPILRGDKAKPNPAALINSQDENSMTSDSTTSTGAVPGFTVHPDSTIRIGLLLPFDAEAASAKIYGYLNDKELSKGDVYKLRENVSESLDFYQGLQYAASHTQSPQHIEFYTYDTHNSDSVVEELLKLNGLKSCQIVIGPTNVSEAKIVASWCKDNQIVNLQPFTPSKSIGTDNPYLVRLMPTIDAHLQKEYEMVIDSFADRNIVIYTAGKEHDLSAARQLDTLFHQYNLLNNNRLKYRLYNTGDTSRSAAKKTLASYLSSTSQNVLLVTCYEEALVNSVLRTIKENTVVFGMPTWMDGDQLRPEYLNKAQPYITDNFHADTSSAAGTDFIGAYRSEYEHRPSRYSYMGYDAMNYLLFILGRYGLAVRDGFTRESYDGLGYSFHISPLIRMQNMGSEMTTNYYANTAMHLYQIRDYHVWFVK